MKIILLTAALILSGCVVVPNHYVQRWNNQWIYGVDNGSFYYICPTNMGETMDSEELKLCARGRYKR
jgi:hypothetical protein